MGFYETVSPNSQDEDIFQIDEQRALRAWISGSVAEVLRGFFRDNKLTPLPWKTINHYLREEGLVRRTEKARANGRPMMLAPLTPKGLQLLFGLEEMTPASQTFSTTSSKPVSHEA